MNSHIFPKTWVISLNNPTDFIESMALQNINVNLFKGVDGETIKKQEYMSSFYTTFGPNSAIGCAMSHMKLWEKLVNDDLNETYLIFEDDAYSCEGGPCKGGPCKRPCEGEEPDNTKDKIINFLNNIPKDFDIGYLGYFGSSKNIMYYITSFMHKTKGHGVKDKGVVQPKVMLGLHSYIISKKGAKILLNELKGKVYNHIDYCIQQLYKQDKLKNYAIHPIIFKQTSTDYTFANSKSSNTLVFPTNLTRLVSKYYIDDTVTMDNLINIKMYKIPIIPGGIGVHFNITVFTIILILISIISVNLNVPLKWISLFYVLLVFPDIVKQAQNVLLHYILILIIYRIFK